MTDATKGKGAMQDKRKGKGSVRDEKKGKTALPFEPLVPNAKTIAAIREARRGGLKSYRSVKAILRSLNADD
jgi:hypothetical protein